MPKTKLVYMMSLRNAAADQAGQQVPYQGESRYMMSPLEHLARLLDDTRLGDAYELTAVLYDDDAGNPRDRAALGDFGFGPDEGEKWIFPRGLTVQGRRMVDLLQPVPSSYRREPRGSAAHRDGKRDFERRVRETLDARQAGLVLLDGLLVILSDLIQPHAPYHRRIVNIHPGLTSIDSPYERRGATATLDALYGARGLKVTDWATRATVAAPRVDKTGASFHYVDEGIDSGEVIVEVLDTPIAPDDTILELRWNNFNRSLFPAIEQGLGMMRERLLAQAGRVAA